MQKKKINKPKKKIDKMNVAAIIVTIVALLGLTAVVAGCGLIFALLKGKPEINLEDFSSSESSIILDRNGEQISELGTVLRQNVEYDELPTILVDAFVAVEDSRFFTHNGFDIPRFVQAIFSNLKTMSFSQGGSTFTMQLVKNTYFVDDEAGQGAAKSIQRKVQELALALELESKTNKKDIFINYLNKINFGGTSQNIRGVQKASQYYYGKDVSELNLPEAAMLAGVINSPYLFNPFNYLEYAQDRRDEVLYLMHYHGYISDSEYKWALSTKVEDFLYNSSENHRGANEGIPYQAYIDAVVEEVYDLTGLDPYTTPMVITTCMDKNVQELMDNIQAGEVDDYFTYPDDEFEVASICVNNSTGEIVGILGGRNYADGGALLLNHATEQYKQPGSSIKPILDYVQAFEVLGWSTSHVLCDKPTTYIGTDYIIANSTNTYAGDVTLEYAVAMSLNTPAIQTIRQLQDAKGDAYLVDYMQKMGFNIDANDFDEQYAIGGKGLQVSCEQLAAAYAALLNNGYYNKPHTISKIEYLSDKTPYTYTKETYNLLSEQSCFQMSELLKNNVNGGYPNLMGLFRNDNYQVYAKTGTTNWGVEGAAYDIPNGSIKDGWVVAGTSEYTVATWMGYEKAQKDKVSYMSITVYNQNIKGKITKLILDKTAEIYGNPSDIEKPSGISKITHIIGTFPYAATIEGMDSAYITSGYINSNSKYANLVKPQGASVESMTGEPKVTLSGTTLKLEWPAYPNSDALEVAPDTKDISLVKNDGTKILDVSGKRIFDYSWIYGPIVYKADIYVNGNRIDSVSSSDGDKSYDLGSNISTDIKVDFYYAYEKSSESSNVVSKKVDTSTIQDVTISSDDKETVKSYLTNKGISVIEKEGSANHSSKGKVEKVVITANGQTKELTNGGTWTTNFTGASAEIYIYKDASASITRTESTSGSGTIVKFTVSVVGADDVVSYSWYKDNNSTAESETSNQISYDSSDAPTTSLKVVIKLSDNSTIEATWSN